MRNSKINYLIAGGFVLAMLVGLVVSAAMLTGRTGATDEYYAIYKNVTGVKFGTQVLYEGYPIGQVDEVTPVPEGSKMSFKVNFSISKDWRLPEDSIANIAAPGLLSAITLSVTAGTSENILKPGSQVRGRENSDMFALMSTVADDISDLTEKEIRPLLHTINRTVGTFGDMIEGSGEEMVGDLAGMVRDISTRTPRIIDNIEQITNKVNRSSDELNALLTTENREKIESLIANMDKAATNFTQLSGNLDSMITDLSGVVTDNKSSIEKSVVDLRYVADSVARHIDSLNQNMDAASRNMYEFSRQIRQNPGLLLGGTPPKDNAPR
ncbi:MAG: MCE family protein [Rhodospirillaceae bacterium]|nr:MCE family protein [Rhodospirillaceae bacterium]